MMPNLTDRIQMHDNDSDTGLLVRNSNGDQWLCYGKAKVWDGLSQTCADILGR